MSRNLVSITEAACHRNCSDQTIRNYIRRGYFPAYRNEKNPRAGVLIDLDEMDEALDDLPQAKVRAGVRAFGKYASVYSLHPDARR
ncbi:hypothetical protein BI49514_02980 [Brevibacterium iodinum ATCC 49514]|uniref:Helix-turn-helix domain-containing protein n=1 Tax=Brevibacterium iodinum ATCC 49514 TaxID=1255616 RepID=A0A2H1KGC5_9MICO|nr:hypothetical protein BI49514_02980 [Brevibacterium iodinum ATCC 49514]SUW13267.1 Uncharacterised protein [Brevibacterium iodinum]